MVKFTLVLVFAAVLAFQGLSIVEVGGSALRTHNYTVAHATE